MPDAFDDLLIEVVEELLAGVVARLGNLRFEFLLELIELELNLLGCAALLVDADDALLKFHAGLDGTDDLVAGSEDAIEELELFREKLVDANIGGVRLVEEVDDNHVVLLAVAVASSDALLDPLRVPGHIVVDDQIAELEIDALGCGFGCNHDAGLIAEVLDKWLRACPPWASQ